MGNGFLWCFWKNKIGEWVCKEVKFNNDDADKQRQLEQLLELHDCVNNLLRNAIFFKISFPQAT